jgi:ElaA protein
MASLRGFDVTNMPGITKQWQRFSQLAPQALYEVLRFRQDIFVVEQSSPYPDLDGLDQGASHLLLRVERRLAGYLRLVSVPDTPSLRIGRVAVAAHLRRRGLGRILMEEALRFCREQHPSQDIGLSAQIHQVPFYGRFGFVVTSDPYDDFGVPHVDMRMSANNART